MAVLGISIAAILSATAFYLVLGAYWYSPLGLGRPWMEAMGYNDRDEIDKTRARGGYLVGAIGALVAAVALDTLMDVSQLAGPWAGAALGGLAGLAFQAALTAPTSFFEERDPILYAISAAYNVLALVGMGAIVGWLGS